MNNPLVSIVVPVYNAESFIRPTLDTICKQSHHNLEIILVNDGSSDGTAPVLDEYATRDARIRVIHKGNQGAAAARNDGLDVATGEFVIVLDSDDLFDPDMVKIMVERALEQQVDIVLCNASTEFSNSQEVLHEACQNMALAKEVLNITNCCPRVDAPQYLFQIFKFGVAWNKLMRMEFVRKHGLRFQLLSSSNDFYFSHSALILAESVSLVDKELIHYQIRNNSISHSKERNIGNALKAINAVKQFMQEQKVPSCMFDSLALFAMDLLGWNLYQTAAAPDTVCKLIGETIHLFPELLHRQICNTSLHSYYRVFEALHCPDVALILPELSPQQQPTLFKNVQQLVDGDKAPLYSLRVLYAKDDGAPIARNQLTYPVALPVQVPSEASIVDRISICQAFPLPAAEIVVWPGCNPSRILMRLRQFKRKLLWSRIMRLFAFTSAQCKKWKNRNRISRAHIQRLNLLLAIIK